MHGQRNGNYWGNQTPSIVRFFNISQCHPTTPHPHKSPPRPAPTQTTLAATPSGLSTLPRFFRSFPPRLQCTSAAFLSSTAPIYFPLIFSTPLLHSLALSLCTLSFLPLMVHPFIHNPHSQVRFVFPFHASLAHVRWNTCTQALAQMTT